MRITALQQQKKRPGRISVFVDDAFVFGTSVARVQKAGLRIGQEIDEARLAVLQDDAEFAKYYDRAVSWLLLRPRSRWELAQYVRKLDITDAGRRRIIDKAHDSQLLDDERFARSWVESRRSHKLRSRRHLQQELQAKRVSSDVITRVLAEDETQEVDVLAALIVKKQRLSRYKDTQKLTQYLMRQGYRYSDITSVLSNVEN